MALVYTGVDENYIRPSFALPAAPFPSLAGGVGALYGSGGGLAVGRLPAGERRPAAVPTLRFLSIGFIRVESNRIDTT